MPGDRTHIVFLTHWAAHLGGAEHSLLDILRCASVRFSCTVVTTEAGTLTRNASELGARVVIVPCRRDLSRIRRDHLLRNILAFSGASLAFLTYTFRLASVLGQLDPDLVHANVPKSHLALMLARIWGVKAHCTFHVREIFGKKSGAVWLYRLLMPRRHSSVIAISTAVQQALPQSLIRFSTVVYNGVRVPRSGFPRPTHDPLCLVYLGRVVPWKGCGALIDILAELLARCGDDTAVLNIIGDTLYWPQSYRTELQEKIASLGLAEKCSLLPHTLKPLETLAQNDIFCNASQDEPFGRSIAEAQACGLPVIAFDTGGVAEIVIDGQTGRLVPYGNKPAFVDALQECICSPQKIQWWGEKGRKRIQEKFNAEKQIPSIVSFLEKKGAQG